MSEDFSQYNGEGTTLRKAQLRLLEMLIEVDRICKKHNIPYWLDGGSALGAVRHGGFIPWDDDIDIALLRKDYNKLIKILPEELPEQYVLQNRNTEPNLHISYSRVVDKNSLSDYGDDRLPFRRKLMHQGLFLDIVFIEKGNLKLKRIVDYIHRRVFFHLTLYDNKVEKYLAHILWPIVIMLVSLIRAISALIPSDKYIFGYGITFNRNLRKSEIFPPNPILFEGFEFPAPKNVHGYLKRYYGDYMKIPPENERWIHANKIEVY